MQQTAGKCCIRPSPSYLSHPLKPDNLAPICNNISEKVLRGKLQAGCRSRRSDGQLGRTVSRFRAGTGCSRAVNSGSAIL